MKRGSTIFLRGVVVFIGIAVLALCIFGLPRFAVWFTQDAAAMTPIGSSLYYPILIWLYAPAIPFFWALYQTLKLLGYIDRKAAFSILSVKALRKIQYCATAMSILYALGMPFVYFSAKVEDAPGLVLVGAAFACSPMVIATFAAVLQRLLKEAIDIKSENDSTI